MGQHSRPGPPNQPSRASRAWTPDDPLAPYHKRRRPPVHQHRRHRPLHGGGSHVLPGQPRVLEERDGFSYTPVGTAPDLAAARRWMHESVSGAEPEG
ncbi:DUF6087 family protein [Streptomyces coffeae]|uniref:DUF6087 family protein n=1 Tax=Streptomyces coffeae TaxID=621382 RepID=UPI001F2C1825|nr:DUF6087 family protein [Streptomyces coffeae]